jgi:hypothetical protein
MAKTKDKLLKGFGKMVADLQLLFRSRPSLSENEQLFIENRLMILQWEYHLWAGRSIKILSKPKKDQSPHMTAGISSSSPSGKSFH